MAPVYLWFHVVLSWLIYAFKQIKYSVLHCIIPEIMLTD